MNIGYACVNITLGLSVGKTLTQANCKNELAIYNKIQDNLFGLYSILKWNKENKILFYRMSSSMFPHITNESIKFGNCNRFSYSIRLFSDYLKMIGDYSKEHKMRLTFHPGQYTLLSSESPDVTRRAINDIIYHAVIFKLMGLNVSDGSCMVIHGGGIYNDKQSALKRIVKNYRSIPKFARDYIIFENDEFRYNIHDILRICKTVGAPACFDTHHFSVYNMKNKLDYTPERIDSIMDKVVKTWNTRRPKIHISNQDPNKRPGAHSKYITEIPDYIYRLLSRHNNAIDIMFEAKGKELSVLKFRTHPGIEPGT